MLLKFFSPKGKKEGGAYQLAWPLPEIHLVCMRDFTDFEASNYDLQEKFISVPERDNSFGNLQAPHQP